MTKLPSEERPGPELWVTGLGTRYPKHRLYPHDLDLLAAQHHDIESEGLKKLLAINRKTGIHSRASALDFKQGFATSPNPPTIAELDDHFRKFGVDFAVKACDAALRDAGFIPKDVTHTFAVTCTNQGSPGYNLLVHERLGIRGNVDRTLLHGVECAGGLSIMRVAAQMALASTARGRPARVLAFACELCTPNVRSELGAAEKCSAEDVCFAAALFSDGAAAFVLKNSLGKGQSIPKFQLCAFDNAVLPETMDHMSFSLNEMGTRTVLSRAIPLYTTEAVGIIFGKLTQEYSACFGSDYLAPIEFDWALHPGGNAILEGVKVSMALMDYHLRAAREIYRTCGNSSSPSVLAVLDLLRSAGDGHDHIVAASFGPGLSVEMAMLRRCRELVTTDRANHYATQLTTATINGQKHGLDSDNTEKDKQAPSKPIYAGGKYSPRPCMDSLV